MKKLLSIFMSLCALFLLTACAKNEESTRIETERQETGDQTYSTNEKIFYPPEKLDTRDSPLAKGGIGTLAYYEPWGDMVFFYGDYRENSSLFELGKVVSGEEMICEMSGTLTIDFVQES